MTKKRNLENLRLPVIFTLLSAVFYICLVVFTAPEKQEAVQGYDKVSTAPDEIAPLPFYWLERAPAARSRFSVDGATRVHYFLRASGLPDPQNPPKAYYVVEEGIVIADQGRRGGGGGGRQRGGPQTAPNPDSDDDLPERSPSGSGREGNPRSRDRNTSDADAAEHRGIRQGGNGAAAGGRPEGRNRAAHAESPGQGEGRPARSGGNTGGREGTPGRSAEGGGGRSHDAVTGRSAGPDRDAPERQTQASAPKPPRAFMADAARNEDGVWLISAVIGLSGRVTLYVENDHNGTHYFASTVISSRSQARENFVAPEEIPVPKRLPVFTVKAAQNQVLSFRTGMPVTLELHENGRALPDNIMFADFLHRNYRRLDLSMSGAGNIKQAAFVEEEDPRLDRAGVTSKTTGFVTRDQNGDIFAFMTEISRDNTARNHRAAGFVTAGLSFLLALMFALFMRFRFKSPHERRVKG